METQNNTCKILLRGPLDQQWEDYLGDLSCSVVVEGGRITTSTLTGNPADLAAFIGILNSVHNLGHTVIFAEFATAEVRDVGAVSLIELPEEPTHMATLSLIKFSTPDGAEKMLTTLENLQKQGLIQIQDAALVTWAIGAKKPKTRQLNDLTGAGALNGAFWGLLFGLIFFIPFVGLAIGLTLGALAGHFSDYGIDDNFIKQSRDKITEGTSGLYLLTANAVLDKLADAVKDRKFEIVSTNLSREEEQKLRDAFGD